MNAKFRRETLTTNTSLNLLGEQTFSNEADLTTWLNSQAESYKLTTLLAHADDGIIWGKYLNGWQLAHDHFPVISPQLRLDTLQECRMFHDAAEVYLWRDEANTWQARLIQDSEGNKHTIIDEAQLLWGTDCKSEAHGFSHLYDGTMQNQHTPPLTLEQLSFDEDHNFRPVRLWVRHYLDSDANIELPDKFKVGLTYIAYSRLVTLDPKPEVK